MPIDLQKRYVDFTDFFASSGSATIKLTREAAVAVCLEAAGRGFVVARTEGGIWHNPGFEARLDCIWDGIAPPATLEATKSNNFAAAEFIRREHADHDVFVITAPSMSGW